MILQREVFRFTLDSFAGSDNGGRFRAYLDSVGARPHHAPHWHPKVPQEKTSVPRLTIIIPHRNNDSRLESTMLSVLENRPHDCEVIVVHDGSYANPYQLDDEVLFVEDEHLTAGPSKLNAGLMAACAPVVCVVMDGISVAGDWYSEPLQTLTSRDNVFAVSPTVLSDGKRQTYGIDSGALANSHALQTARVELTQPLDCCAGPEMCCGFYRTRTLRALGGWNERIDETLADIDLAWLAQELELRCVISEASQVSIETSPPRSLCNQATQQLARLAVSYGVSSGGTTVAMSDLLRGCLSGHVSQAVAWAAGMIGKRPIPSVHKRIESARQRIAEQAPALKVFGGDDAYRRYAA